VVPRLAPIQAWRSAAVTLQKRADVAVGWGSLPGRLAAALEAAAAQRAIAMAPEARKAWEQIYPDLSEGRPGLLGAATARAEAYVIRLAVAYAMLDRSEAIGLPHLEAAIAV
jgi:hypothetical protein